jgi:uncharacterized membrane protein
MTALFMAAIKQSTRQAWIVLLSAIVISILAVPVLMWWNPNASVDDLTFVLAAPMAVFYLAGRSFDLYVSRRDRGEARTEHRAYIKNAAIILLVALLCLFACIALFVAAGTYYVAGLQWAIAGALRLGLVMAAMTLILIVIAVCYVRHNSKLRKRSAAPPASDMVDALYDCASAATSRVHGSQRRRVAHA